MPKPIINTWEQLTKLIPQATQDLIIKQWRLGDPDWLIDLCNESNNDITDGSAFYIHDFHGYTCLHQLNSEGIYESLKTILNT